MSALGQLMRGPVRLESAPPVGTTRDRAGVDDTVARQDLAYLAFRETKYFPALDILRAFSIAAVICHHTMPYALAGLGHHGVTLFFAISGFLITTLILRSKDDRSDFSIKSFYIKRTLRIWPVYFATLLVYVLIVPVFEKDLFYKQQFFQNIKYFATFTSNWFVPLDHPRVIFFFAWSLAAEEQFYLVWPWVQRYLQGMWPAFAAGMLLLLGWVVAIAWPTADQELWWRIVLSIPPAICLGAIVGHLMHEPRTFRMVVDYAAHPAAVAAAVALVLGTIALSPRIPYPTGHILVSLAMAALVVASVVRQDNIMARLAAFRPLVWLGVVSYGVYLLHMLVANAVRRAAAMVDLQSDLLLFVGTLVGATVLASLSYRYYERPFLALKDRWRL